MSDLKDCLNNNCHMNNKSYAFHCKDRKGTDVYNCANFSEVACMNKNIIIVDIDGTIAKVGDRLKYLKESPKNWDAFYDSCFDDEPISEIIDLVKSLWVTNNKIVFCTGRRESVRLLTETWLFKHLHVICRDHMLLMRPNNDYRHDTECKIDQVKKAGIDFNDIKFVLEDRNSMVKKWRELGVIAIQVAEGDF